MKALYRWRIPSCLRKETADIAIFVTSTRLCQKPEASDLKKFRKT